MIDYFNSVGPSVPDNALHRFCKDEGLDYLHTVSRGKERRKTRKKLFSFKGLTGRRRRKNKVCRPSSPCKLA